MCDWLQDVFSMGCLIAELFMEGKALFDLSKVCMLRESSCAACGGHCYLYSS